MSRDHFPEACAAWKRLKTAWADYRLARRQLRAMRRLQRAVDQARASFEVQDYRRRREAALKHTRCASA